MFKEEMIKTYTRIVFYSMRKFAIEQEYELDNDSAVAFSERCAIELYEKIFETSGGDRSRKGTKNLME